jgi:hypothetical protein
MTNVSEWSTSAGSNNAAPPDGAPENMLPGKVNDCMREMMAALAKWYKDSSSSLVTTGTTTAYTLTTNSVHTALSDVPLMSFRIHAANTGAATLAVDGLVAKALVRNGGTALASGDLIANQLVSVAYNPNLDRFEIIGPFTASAAELLALLLTADGAGSGLDADLLDGLSSAAFAQVANNLSDLASAATAFTNIKQAATDAATGVVELATVAEAKARADTTRVVTPAGLTDFARIKTGTYTGDGSTSQAITGIGFQPKYVQIVTRSTTEVGVFVYETTDVIMDDITGGAAIVHDRDSGEHYLTNDAIIALGADGFTVDDNGSDFDPNAAGVLYNYLCLG